jgi:hypothetical protein
LVSRVVEMEFVAIAEDRFQGLRPIQKWFIRASDVLHD